MSRIFSRVTFTLILAVVLSTLGASNVFAESPRLGEFTVATVEQMERLRERLPDAPPVTELGALVGPGRDYARDLVDNPWGCYGQTDYPHASDSEGPWVVNVHARTVCPNGFEVPEIWVETELYRQTHCFLGFCFGLEPWGPEVSDTAYNAYSIEVTTHGPCENGRYRAISAHWMLGPDGNTYGGITSNSRKVSNCP